MSKTRIAMSIAGSDSGGGAGIQADLKTFAALNVYGTCVITAVTAQNTVEVSDFEMMSNKLISSQFNSLVSDIYPNAIKIGMLGSDEIVLLVSKLLKTIFQNLIIKNKLINGIIYLQITRGVQSREHAYKKNLKPNIIVYTAKKKFNLPNKILEN